jgi:2-polyprenyl-6-methoxyphenol hydroxylase-like FAD-dependent oxidoreductase
MKVDVLIAGAGPVGLALAAELARYGVSVRIVEKAPQRTDRSKAIVIWSRTLELMDRMGCSQSFIDAGLKVTAANIVAGVEKIALITLDGIASPHPYALMLPQSDTERLLEQQLNACGAQLERSVELTQFTSTADEVVSTLRHADGREETLNSSWLIGCDGAHSVVRHQLGVEFTGSTMPSNWLLADLHLTGAPNPGDITVSWHTDGVLAIFPLSKDRFRVIADVGGPSNNAESSEPNLGELSLEEVQQVLDKRGPGGIKAFDPVWLAYFHISERKVSDYRVGRVFLVGDAAHIHSPAGGQGMNTGIQDACNLAWKLALVCHGTCAPEPLLGSYSIERSAVGDEVLKNAGRLTEVAVLHGEIKQSIRNHLMSLVLGLSPVRHMAADTLSELAIGYPKSPLSIDSGHHHSGPAAGARAPLHGNENDKDNNGEQPIGAGDRPRFALCCEPGEEASHLIARYPRLLEASVRKPYKDGGLWLVRPDGYVGFTAKANAWDEAAKYLYQIGAAR